MNSIADRFGGVPIAVALERPRNGFTVVRLGLALAVVVSHAFSVTTGAVENEPLAGPTGFTLGEHAVNGFFAISGFLVTMSFARRGWRDYVVARTLRILPGLVAATALVAIGLGLALTSLPAAEYLASPRLWGFIRGTLTTFKSNAALPGVFADNPFAFPMGTVWTLKYEVLCYAGVLAAGLAGLLGHRSAAPLVVAGLALGLLGLDAVQPEAAKGLQTAFRLPLIFAAGGALYLWRDQVRLSAVTLAVLCGVTLLLGRTFAYQTCLFLTEAYGVLWLALQPALARPVFDLDEDLSYGTYLYGWPVQQALRQLYPTASAWGLLGPALVTTLAVALASWRLIEKPALALKARLLRGRPVPAAPASP